MLLQYLINDTTNQYRKHLDIAMLLHNKALKYSPHLLHSARNQCCIGRKVEDGVHNSTLHFELALIFLAGAIYNFRSTLSAFIQIVLRIYKHIIDKESTIVIVPAKTWQ